MSLAVVRSLRSPRRLSTGQELEDFEQELVDQYALAMVASGVTDDYVSMHRTALFEFIRFVDRPVWMVETDDADRYLAWLRRNRGQAKNTMFAKAMAVRATTRGASAARLRACCATAHPRSGRPPCRL